MLFTEKIKSMAYELRAKGEAEIVVGQNEIAIHIFDCASKFSLSASVYEGQNYIPNSVRESTLHKPPFAVVKPHSYLTIDEENFQIHVHLLEQAKGLADKEFVHLLEDFSHLADQWREYLDDYDKKDLIYIKR